MNVKVELAQRQAHLTQLDQCWQNKFSTVICVQCTLEVIVEVGDVWLGVISNFVNKHHLQYTTTNCRISSVNQLAGVNQLTLETVQKKLKKTYSATQSMKFQMFRRSEKSVT